MNLKTLKTSNSKSLIDFIKYWSLFYSYSKESLYNDSINKQLFTNEDIQNLFIWKNGMKMSRSKQKSIDLKIITKISIINDFKQSQNVDLELFQSFFNNISAVWKIFLLHIIKPNTYPIYDQHVHRTYNFINNLDHKNISNTTLNDKNKEIFYFESYLPFIKSNNIDDLEKLDKAFFTFGQFLRTKNYEMILKQ